jgi:hypothetical protein
MIRIIYGRRDLRKEETRPAILFSPHQNNISHTSTLAGRRAEL